MAYRIGIDVGGTFTHAVAVDGETLAVVRQAKVPTTHRAAEGVALGVTQSLQALLDAGIRPADVSFIAHSTTQATNALLEGDVAVVGVLGMGRGGDAMKARGDTDVGDIEVAPGRLLRTVHIFLPSDGLTREAVQTAVEDLRTRGAQVIVASEAFGVDDPAHELLVMEVAAESGLPATASHEVSGLYGLRVRTRTAVINAGILPKMLQTADMTAGAVARAGISAPLMIMRSDGGVMSLAEMRRRPILTILSGPAAGVAAALMYARISDGIFLEVGGTSTDITVVRNGRAAVRGATVGGHKLFLRTLDVRTIGLAGGSMLHVSHGHVTAVGPRSAHLAGLEYSCFAAQQGTYHLETIQPLPNDPDDYAVAVGAGLVPAQSEGVGAGLVPAQADVAGRGQAPPLPLALTMTCLANAAGRVPAGDYAVGAGRVAAQLLDAEAALRVGCALPQATVEELIRDYALTREHVSLVGGGGGAAAVVPMTAELLALPWRIAENAPVISAIGVALALVRDSVERTIPNPTKEDLLRLRREAVEAAVRAGANPDTVEVQVEVDPQQQIVRATATGSTELRTREVGGRHSVEPEMRAAAAHSLSAPIAEVRPAAETPFYTAYTTTHETTRLFGLLKTRRTPLRLVDREGIVRLQLADGTADAAPATEAIVRLRALIAARTHYGDGGEELPAVFLAAGPRLVDLSGLLTLDHVLSLAEEELEHTPEDAEVLLIVGNQGLSRS